MKEIAGGAWIAGLFAGAIGCWWGLGALVALGCIAAAGSWYSEQLAKKQAASWRAQYPRYRY